MLSTDKAWEKWGRDDPYFGVLADERFAADRIDASRELFFATGESWVAGLLEKYQQHFGPLGRGRALDHGCGVGRLTLPLAAAFREVVALDVSRHMLAEAARNAAASGRSTIRFCVADDLLTEAHGRFDFVNSHLVLQHIPVRRGLVMIDALIDRAAPGGGFHIQFTLRTDRGGPRWLYWASANIPGVKLVQNILAGRALTAPAMQMNDYPLGKIVAGLAARGITNLLITTAAQPRFTSCSLLGRRPG